MSGRQFLPEQHIAGKRLGRHQFHDDRNRNYPAAQASELRSVSHRHYGKPLDQGNLGSCTGNAVAQALNCKGLHRAGVMLHEPDALRFYETATALDDFAGTYPPDDTGSDGGSACKAAVQAGNLTGYHWAFGIDEALAALVLNPVITGTIWTGGCDEPDANGFLNPRKGTSRGGHEYCIHRINVRDEWVQMIQSWGDWGPLHGYARIRFADWDWLLQQGGDVTVPSIVPTTPTALA